MEEDRDRGSKGDVQSLRESSGPGSSLQGLGVLVTGATGTRRGTSVARPTSETGPRGNQGTSDRTGSSFPSRAVTRYFVDPRPTGEVPCTGSLLCPVYVRPTSRAALAHPVSTRRPTGEVVPGPVSSAVEVGVRVHVPRPSEPPLGRRVRPTGVSFLYPTRGSPRVPCGR